MHGYDCIDCIAHANLELIKMCTDEPAERAGLARESLMMLAQADYDQSPVAVTGRISRFIRESTGTFDPFEDVKIKRNQRSAEIARTVAARLSHESDTLFGAFKAATAGNILDATAGDDNLLEVMVEKIFSSGFVKNTYESFLEAFSGARTILYIADNAGEIFFDKLLVEEFVKRGKRVVFCVRGMPAADDALEADYRATGLDSLTELVTTGTAHQGVVFDEASDEFLRAWKDADLILSKGLGNFETLAHLSDKRLFLLFIAKCAVVAELVGVQLHDFCFIRGGEIACPPCFPMG